MKVVYDCGNGAGALVAPQLFKRLGIQARGLFCESDGTFQLDGLYNRHHGIPFGVGQSVFERSGHRFALRKRVKIKD